MVFVRYNDDTMTYEHEEDQTCNDSYVDEYRNKISKISTYTNEIQNNSGKQNEK